MNLIERLVKLKESLADDGSKELVDHWIDSVHNAGELDQLLKNSAFSRILGKMQQDFRARLHALVKKDPELVAMKRMFVRTLGQEGAKNKIEESLDLYIKGQEDPE